MHMLIFRLPNYPRVLPDCKILYYQLSFLLLSLFIWSLLVPVVALSGIYPAFLTPLDRDLRLVPSIAEKLLHHLMDTGVDGTYVAGSTGEGLRLSLEQRRLLTETIAHALPAGKKLIVHVGTPSVSDALALADHAARSGAHAISSLPPAGDALSVRAYYEELAKYSSLPLILYYFPKAAPTAFQNSQELIDISELPNVIGVKFTDFNVYLLQQLAKRSKLVFNGYDEALVAGLLMGARGGIGSTYNVMPQVYLEIYRAACRGDWETARQWQSRANSVLDILLRYPFFPALRAVMAHRGFDCGPLLSGDDFVSSTQRLTFLQDFERNLPVEVADLIHWPARQTT
jgi:N-acetylneuraminate lyase